MVDRRKVLGWNQIAHSHREQLLARIAVCRGRRVRGRDDLERFAVVGEHRLRVVLEKQAMLLLDPALLAVVEQHAIKERDTAILVVCTASSFVHPAHVAVGMEDAVIGDKRLAAGQRSVDRGGH